MRRTDKLMRVLVVLGTRPEAIKMAPVINELARRRQIMPLVCVTGQHRQMLDSVLSLFHIKPDYDLNVMKHAQNVTEVTCAVLDSLPQVIRESQPDVVLVQGDTTTTMAAALAAYYEKVPVGHVEAGLRSGNIYSPWPEEVNRRIASVIATLHFAPTEQARQNLLNEQVPESQVVVTGNTVVDALISVIDGIANDPLFRQGVDSRYHFLGSEDGKHEGRNLILVTAHRRESFGEGLEAICGAIRELARRPDVAVVYPVHPNPMVREPVFRSLGGVANIYLIDPLDYRSFVYFMSCSRLILTDSGGVLEEAPALGKPVLVMREVTERTEGLQGGTATLVGTDHERIVEEAARLLENEEAYREMCQQGSPYGDGRASQRIVDELLTRHF